VSYHAIVERDGDCATLVSTRHQAFHAGASAWEGRPHVNGFSVGLAMTNRNDGTEMLTAQQIAVAQGMVEGWAWTVRTLERVVTHKMIAPGRKVDPEVVPNFDLSVFEAAFARGVAGR
jgi:AmpD protein